MFHCFVRSLLYGKHPMEALYSSGFVTCFVVFECTLIFICIDLLLPRQRSLQLMMMTVPSAGTQCSLHANYPAAISSTSKMIIIFLFGCSFLIWIIVFVHCYFKAPLMLDPFSLKEKYTWQSLFTKYRHFSQ